MDEESIKLLARISALELLLGKLFALVYGPVMRLARDEVIGAHKTLRDVLKNETLVKTDDPALSDLLSAEIEAQIDRFLLLLHHKNWRMCLAIGAAQHGHRGSLLTRAAISRRRTVAIEFGMCRSGRRGGAPGSVTVG